jgi:hypothetical protein
VPSSIDLPVTQSTEFEFVISQYTAKALEFMQYFERSARLDLRLKDLIRLVCAQE